MLLRDFSVVDIAKRLYLAYPQGWTPEPTWDDPPNVSKSGQVSPNLKATLLAMAAAWKNTDTTAPAYYDLLKYVKTQTRIATATGFWLDFVAMDFTDGGITRHQHESDDRFRRRLMIEILRPKGTRCALSCGVANLTGYPAKIIEPMVPADTGAWGSQNNVSTAAPWGWSTAGSWGSLRLPFQTFVTAVRPPGSGIPNVGGWSMSSWGWSTEGTGAYGYVGGARPNNYGNGQWCALDQIGGDVTDADIYQTVAESMPAGTTAWTQITDQAPDAGHYGTGMLDINFYLDMTCLGERQPQPPVNFRASVPIMISPAVLLDRLHATATSTLRVSAIATMGSQTQMAASVPFVIRLLSTVQRADVGGIPLGIQTSAAIQTITYLGASSQPPFILGQSALTPPGGKLGRTFILGHSKLGAGQYGY